MNTFPTLPQRYATPKKKNGVVVDYTPNGGKRVRDLGGPTKRQLSVVLDTLSASDADAVDAFYEANKILDFNFTYFSDGVQKTWGFIAPPDREPVKGNRFNVTIHVMEA